MTTMTAIDNYATFTQKNDDKKEKPAIYKLYDFTKGGTDIVDQMNNCYTTRAKTLRWSTLKFYYMLDTIRVNSKSLWCIKHGKDPEKDVKRVKPYVDAKLKKTNLENQRSSAKVAAKVFVVCIQCVFVISA